MYLTISLKHLHLEIPWKDVVNKSFSMTRIFVIYSSKMSFRGQSPKVFMEIPTYSPVDVGMQRSNFSSRRLPPQPHRVKTVAKDDADG